MTTPDDIGQNGRPLTPGHAEFLASKAISPEVIERIGIYSITELGQLPEPHAWAGERAVPSIAFPWRTPGGEEFIQLRPDEPFLIEGEKKPRKYLWPAGQSSAIAVVREDPTGPVIFVEGTKQSLAAASYVDSGSVYGIAGCRSWSTDGVPIADLEVVEDRDVVLIFDADLESNPDVWEAANKFTRALNAEGASSIRYVLMPAGGSAGLDDVLGSKKPEKRSAFLRRLIEQSATKLKAKPKKGSAGPTKLPGTDDRPMIVVNEDRKLVIDGITAALRRKWDSTELFNFGEVIARRRGATVTPVDRGMFNDLVAEAASTVAMDPKGNATAAWPDAQSMTAALSRADRYARLHRVARTPFVRADGSICQAEGYDEATETFLALDPALSAIEVPEEPDEEAVASAVKLLRDEWLGDLLASMPDEADRANALGLVLTPLIRGLVPLAPLAVVNGLQMGVGKNLLADVIAIFTTGEVARPLPYSREDEENRKVTTAAFQSGRADLFVFDEAHVIEGAALARAITSITYTDRVLGVSRNAEYPNTVTWLSLGNNVQINGDMSRRTYIIRLAPKGANPHDRSADSFRHPDLKGWTTEHRAELIQAGLTLVRAWVAADRPVTGPGALAGRRMGSFEVWGGMVGGILDVAGVAGFLANLQQWRSDSDYSRQHWIEHLTWLRSTFGEAEFTVAEVVKAMKAKPAGVDHPPRLEDHDVPGYGRLLGQAYGKQKDVVLDGLQLVRTVESKSHGNRWSVTLWGEDGPSGGTDGDGPDTPEPDLGSGGSGGSGGSLLPTCTKNNVSTHVDTHAYTGEGATPIPQIPQIPPETVNAQADPGMSTEGESPVTAAPELYAQVNTSVSTFRDWAPTPDPEVSPIEHLIPAAVAPPVPTCPDCEAEKELVPPARFWFACRACNPATFERD